MLVESVAIFLEFILLIAACLLFIGIIISVVMTVALVIKFIKEGWFDKDE